MGRGTSTDQPPSVSFERGLDGVQSRVAFDAPRGWSQMESGEPPGSSEHVDDPVVLMLGKDSAAKRLSMRSASSIPCQ